MSNRILRDWTDSEKVDQVSYQAEVLFTRLMMKADDYGSFFANPKIIRAQLFPLRLDKVREADISRWLHELQTAGLIALYEADSKPYLRILNFGQRLRNMKKRFPDMPIDSSSRQSAASRGELRPETEEKQETETGNNNRITREIEKSDVVVADDDEFYDENGSWVLPDVVENRNSIRNSPAAAASKTPTEADLKRFCTSMWNDQGYIETVCMANKFNLDQFRDYLTTFVSEKSQEEKYPDSLKEAKSHFMNWVRLRHNFEKPKVEKYSPEIGQSQIPERFRMKKI